ncbi:ATP-binding cassette domain-containing protein [Anaerorhabdus furcosa]|uniref:ABC-type multidrug transport system, ATPase and permease component n=1 Tax=Anaerorhabdus furcosa TaxID=118967 RepID=A0A1T4LMF4_9FIRM|nr:ABC transporter ATP-binding protein [Anaerorhabdus furcosa]SJZ55708.1 ABC-type multidrug transport system, ATPase and permease component [Anaerorhabdus furcosa]
MAKYLKEIRVYIAFSLLFYILETLVASAMLLMPGYLIDNYKKGFNIIAGLITTYVVLYLVNLLVCYISNRLADYRRIKFEKNLKSDFFNAVLNKDYDNFSKYDVGEYISMQANDISELCQNYLSPYISIYRSLIMIIVFGIALIVFVDFRIAFVILASSLIAGLSPKITSKNLSSRNHHYLASVGVYTEAISKFFDTKLMLDKRSMKAISEVHEKNLDNVLDKNMHFRKLNSLSFVINGGAVDLVMVISFITVTLLLVNNDITIGMATTTFLYSTKFIEPLYELNLNIGRVKSVEKIREKLMLIINEKNSSFEHEKISSADTITIKNAKKRVHNFTISYPDFTFAKGNSYLIAGDNGTGKSVLTKIMMNFITLDKGCIEYDKKNIEKLEVSNLVSYSPQTSVILSGDYYDNVSLYGSYSLDNLEQYEKMFPIEVIEKIKNQENLKNLSGGEKQIISLLRVFCSEKKWLLLDEPFSAMNERIVRYFLERFAINEKTFIIVAHNYSEYVNYFDHVYKIDSKAEKLI